MTVSRHLLRRTARQREQQIERAQKAVQGYEASPATREHAKQLLKGMGVDMFDLVKVEKAQIGPFRYRVVTYR